MSDEDDRREWADEMVADAAALLDAAQRALRSSAPWPADPTAEESEAFNAAALALATLAAQRAVAADLLDAMTAELDEEPPAFAARRPASERPAPRPPEKPASGFSLVSPKPKPPEGKP